MVTAPGQPLRAHLALGFAIAALTLLAGLTGEVSPATADPVPLPPVFTPKPPSHRGVPFAPPKGSTGPLKPKVEAPPPKVILTPQAAAAAKKREKESKKVEEERELEKELEGEKGHSSCSHGFGSSITNKLSVSCMTEQAVDKIFGLPDGFGVSKLLRGVLKVPDFVSDSRTKGAKGISNAEWLTSSVGFALLMAVITFALLHYLVAGMLSSGGGVFIDGVTRCVGAALLILAWPFIFQNVVNITNVVTATVIPERSVDGALGMVAQAAEGGGGGAGLLVMIAFAVLLLILLMVKIGLLVGLLIAFVGMPLALALWPVPALAGPTSYAIRFIGMALTVVVLWAICFRVFGALKSELATWGAHDLGVGKGLLRPLLGLGSLLALLSIPRHAVQMWNVAPQKGTVSSMMQYAASNVIASSIRGGGRRRTGFRGVGRGQARPGGGSRPGGRPGGSGASPGGGGGAGGGSAAAGAMGSSPQNAGATHANVGSRPAQKGPGPGRGPRRGGSAPGPATGKPRGAGGNSRQQPQGRRRQSGSARPAGGQGGRRPPTGAAGGRGNAGAAPQGGGRAENVPRPQGGGRAKAAPQPQGGSGRGGGKSSPSPAPKSGSKPARPNPRPGGSPAAGDGGGKPPRPGSTSHQPPPPRTK